MIISLALIGTILFFRQNPQVAEKAKEMVTKTETEVQETLRTDLLYPDMIIVPPKQLYIARPSANIKTLRFSTTFANIGTGPLEIIGHHDLEQSKTFATQYIRKTTGGGEFRDIGEFIYHPEHNHWHVDEYVQYQIWTIKNGSERRDMVANTGKQSFCIWDEHTYDTKLPSAVKTRFYTSACSRNTQGMSVGWGDTYQARVEGQVIDITNIPDGEYILYYEINPDKKIIEGNYDNNSGQQKISINGTTLRILPN